VPWIADTGVVEVDVPAARIVLPSPATNSSLHSTAIADAGAVVNGRLVDPPRHAPSLNHTREPRTVIAAVAGANGLTGDP
jgi:hypothetical protein